jgi:hypothetical protein
MSRGLEWPHRSQQWSGGSTSIWPGSIIVPFSLFGYLFDLLLGPISDLAGTGDAVRVLFGNGGMHCEQYTP